LGDLFVIRLAGNIIDDAALASLEYAVEKAKNQPGDPLENAVRANITMVVQQLKSSAPILEELVKKGDLTVVGARYDLDDGVVVILP
jgi:carbonic anhydrase